MTPYALAVRRAALSLLLLLVLGACTAPRTPADAPPAPTPARFKALDEQTLSDQPAETRASFRAAHGDLADEEWNAGHNRALIQSMLERASLAATPNPVDTRSWAGTTTISFDTGVGVVGQVYVSINGGPEKTFATASDGAQDAEWIWRGSTYEFRLYAGKNREQLLRTVTVSRANEVATRLGLLSAIVLLVLLGAGVAAGRASKPRLARPLLVAFAVVTTWLVTWLLVTTPPRSMEQQPFPDSFEYADAARHLAAGDGYITTVHDDRAQPPRYPPGFSLVLVPFAAAGGSFPTTVLSSTPWLGALYVVAAAITAWLIGGPIAAGLTAALVGTAPFAIEASSLLMSDALVAALTVLVAGLLQRGWFRAAALMSGGLVFMRLSAVVAVPSVILAVPVSMRRLVALYTLPGVLLLGVFQAATFGSPITTGYDYWLPGLRTFDVAYALQRPMGDPPMLVGDMLNGRLLEGLCPCPDESGPLARLPNVLFYPAVVFGPFWIFAPPVVSLLGLVYAAVHWREPAARFTVVLTLMTLALLTFYVFQAARLAAAPAVLGAIYASAAIARFLTGGLRRG
jgi:hypothetical protein